MKMGVNYFVRRIILILAPKSEEKNVYDLYLYVFLFHSVSTLGFFFPVGSYAQKFIKSNMKRKFLLVLLMLAQ